MREIQYVLLDPTGNRTILVETSIPAGDQPRIAEKLMELEPTAEQVGFFSINGGRTCLRMAGGEFCGNATMSAAALTVINQGIADGTVYVTVAGTPAPVAVSVKQLSDGSLQGTVTMPQPVRISTETFPDGETFPVVRFDGICHVIVESPLSRGRAERIAPEWCRYLNTDALGIMLFDRESQMLSPLVYVTEPETLFWEHSCASGTTAVGAFLAAQEGSVSASLKQPGGTLHIEKDKDGSLRLTGTVRLLGRHIANIAD